MSCMCWYVNPLLWYIFHLIVTCISKLLKHAVFGWLQDSFTGVEQEDRHEIMAGYQKGAQSVGHNFTFTISERTSQYSFFGKYCLEECIYVCIIILMFSYI